MTKTNKRDQIKKVYHLSSATTYANYFHYSVVYVSTDPQDSGTHREGAPKVRHNCERRGVHDSGVQGERGMDSMTP